MKLTMLIEDDDAVDDVLTLWRKLPIDSMLVSNKRCAERLKDVDSVLPLYVYESQSDLKDIGIPTKEYVGDLPSPTIAIIVYTAIDLIRVLAVGGIRTLFLRTFDYAKGGIDKVRASLSQMLSMIDEYDGIEYVIVEATSLDNMAFLKGMGIQHFLITPRLGEFVLHGEY